MPDQIKAKGILRNKNESSPIALSENNGTPTSSSSLVEGNSDAAVPFDRNAVLENTRANAQIHSVGSSIIQKHKLDLEDEIAKDPESAATAAAHLKWNEANLYLNEQEKSATMKITEPKTPFQGAVGDSEYYKPDDEDDELSLPPALDSLQGEPLLLGEPEVSGPDPTIQTDRIIVDEKAKRDDSNDNQDDSEPEETPEERHKRFEAMRKNHYYMKGAVLHKSVEDDDDEE